MKKQPLKIIAITVLTAFMMSCEEEISYHFSVKTGIPNNEDTFLSSGFILIDRVELKIYGSEGDYLLDQNILWEGQTNEKGYRRFTDEHMKEEYWVKAVKDTLNNLRFQDIKTRSWNGSWGGSETERERGFSIRLSNTPTRLELTVMTNFEPVEGAEVQLYLSQKDYDDQRIPSENLGGLGNVYGNWTSANDRSLEIKIDPIFYAETDDQGKVLFDNLEPRKYWFRIVKDALSNQEDTYFLEDKLEDSADITRSVTINIQ